MAVRYATLSRLATVLGVGRVRARLDQGDVFMVHCGGQGGSQRTDYGVLIPVALWRELLEQTTPATSAGADTETDR